VLPISTDRLTLRAFTAADAPAFAAYRSDPAIARYQSWDIPFTVEQAEHLIAGQADLTGPAPGEWLQIAVDRSGTLVGDVAVNLSEDRETAEVGCTLAADHQGHGYAREAMDALLAALFEAVGVHRVTAGIDPRNRASIRLFEQLGFSHEGTDRAAVEIRDEWCDDAHYALDRPLA
jgi:aminoglycoside 6'-N-acetyltransferase